MSSGGGDRQWQSVSKKKPASSGSKSTGGKGSDASPAEKPSMVVDPAFAVLDAAWQAERASAASARSAAEKQASAPKQQEQQKKQANGPAAPAAPAPKKPKAKKAKAPAIAAVAQGLAAGPLQGAIAAAQQRYPLDHEVQLEATASFLLASFKECELPFCKILAEQGFQKVRAVCVGSLARVPAD